MNKGIKKYIRENLSTISKILFLYLLGILIGIVLFMFTDIKHEYVNIVTEIFNTTTQNNFEGINIISNGIRNNIIYIIALYFSLVTIIAPLIICFLVMIKAIITGIYICSILYIFGFFKGIAACFLSTILPIIFSLIGYVIICNNIISIFNSVSQGEKIDIRQIISHIYYLIISISLISFSIVIEQLMTGVIIKMYSNLL